MGTIDVYASVAYSTRGRDERFVQLIFFSGNSELCR